MNAKNQIIRKPHTKTWIDENNQIWEIKEYATLVAMLAGLFSLLPLGLILLRMKFFAVLLGGISTVYICSRKEFWKHATISPSSLRFKLLEDVVSF